MIPERTETRVLRSLSERIDAHGLHLLSEGIDSQGSHVLTAKKALISQGIDSRGRRSHSEGLMRSGLFEDGALLAKD